MARTLFNMLTHACVWYQADGRWSTDAVIGHYSELVLKMLGAAPVPSPGIPVPRALITRRPMPAQVRP
ncbi:hypothetical protein D3C79_1033860 [compost metagenome]